MKFRKKILMIMLACLIGFQPTVNAKHEDLKPMAALIFICFLPKILSLGLIFLKDINERGYSVYRHIKHKWGFESSALRAAKITFMKNLDDFAFNNQCDFNENCYCYLFNKSADAPKIIESFIAGQEECDPKKQLKVFGWDIENLREREKDLFVRIESPKDDLDKSLFIQDALKSIVQYRKNQMGRFIGACCAAYPCQYGIEIDIIRKYPDIKAGMVFNAFRKASDTSVDYDKPSTKKLITTPLLLACIEQQLK